MATSSRKDVIQSVGLKVYVKSTPGTSVKSRATKRALNRIGFPCEYRLI